MTQPLFYKEAIRYGLNKRTITLLVDVVGLDSTVSQAYNYLKQYEIYTDIEGINRQAAIDIDNFFASKVFARRLPKGFHVHTNNTDPNKINSLADSDTVTAQWVCDIVKKGIVQEHGCVSQAARLLGVNRRLLHRKMYHQSPLSKRDRLAMAAILAGLDPYK